MRIAAYNGMPSAGALRAQLSVFIAPLAALSYPFILTGFNASVTTITTSDVGALAWLTATVSLLLAFAVPTIALFAAMFFAEIRQPTVASCGPSAWPYWLSRADVVHLHRRRALHAGRSSAGQWFWVACCCWPSWRSSASTGTHRRRQRSSVPRSSAGRPRYIGARHHRDLPATPHHQPPHRAGRPSTDDAVMKIFRHVYRTEVLQPLLFTLFLFQIGTGLYLVWRHTAAPSDRFRTFQIASGVYLAFYVLGHMTSVFIFARTYLGIETAGISLWVRRPASSRIHGHPSRAPLLVGGALRSPHIAVGTRAVMMAHGASKTFADRFMIGGAVTAGVIATTIMLGMCGLRLQFV